MRRPFSFVLIALCFLSGYVVAQRGRHRDALTHLCTLTQKNFYRLTPAVTAWIDRCRVRARTLPARITTPQWMYLAQHLTAELEVSHFDVYGPADDRALWDGVSVHTGIYSHYVDGHLVVYRVNPHSTAGEAGVEVGDEILSLPGIEEVSPQGASFRAGAYRLRRRGREFDLTLRPGPTGDDGRMTVTTHPSGVRVLRIPTFHSGSFARTFVREIGQRLRGSPRVVVDLRENSGGNFGAMLRTLSLFLESGRVVGSIYQPRRAPTVGQIVDDIDAEYQSDVIEAYGRVELRVPAGYPRYDGPVTVLIANQTASAGEVFAEALRARPGVRTLGWPSAGRALLAKWHGLPELGLRFSVSIPEAEILNVRGESLEGHPVRPERDLYYDLETSLRGEDSWINDAVR